jgi:hypothetical protein
MHLQHANISGLCFCTKLTEVRCNFPLSVIPNGKVLDILRRLENFVYFTWILKHECHLIVFPMTRVMFSFPGELSLLFTHYYATA